VPSDAEAWVTLAHLLRPQGRRGELLADILTDSQGRFRPHDRVFLARSSASGSYKEAAPMEIVSAWITHGRNEGRIVLGFAGVETIAAAEQLAGLDVLVPAEDRAVLTDGSVYVDSLIGCTLHDREHLVGVIRDVQFTTTADGRRRIDEAAPLLVVDCAGEEALIPFVKAFIVSLDLEGKRVLMRLPEGLVGINLRPEERPI